VSELIKVSPLQFGGFASRTDFEIIRSVLLATPRLWYKAKTVSAITSNQETILPCRVGSLTITEISDMVCDPICVPSSSPADSELKLSRRTDPDRRRGISQVLFLAPWGEVEKNPWLIPRPLAARYFIIHYSWLQPNTGFYILIRGIITLILLLIVDLHKNSTDE
jgi:hypothetical protein